MWGRPTYALRGPDNTLIVYTHQTTTEVGNPNAIIDRRVWRVDIETGHRELIWRWNDDRFGQCGEEGARPYQLTLEGKGFEVDPRDGSFYLLSWRPDGVMKFSPDGSECTMISNPTLEIGEGFSFTIAIEEVNLIDDTLFVMGTTTHFIVDQETGDRTRAWDLGPGQLQWDPDEPRWMHLSGIMAPHEPFGVWNFDLEAGEGDQVITRWSCTQGMGDLLENDNHFSERCMDAGNAYGFGDSYQGWMLPGGERFLQVVGTGIIEFETKTGNGNWFML